MPSNGSSQVNIQLTYLQVTEVVKWWLKMTQISYSTHKLQDQKSINGRFKCSTDEPKNWSSHRLQINWTTNHLTNQVKHNKSNTEMSDSQLTRHRPPSWKTDGLTEHPTYWKTTNQPTWWWIHCYNSIKYESNWTKEASENLLSCRSLEMHSKRSGKIYFLAVQYDYWHQCKTQNYGVYWSNFQMFFQAQTGFSCWQ